VRAGRDDLRHSTGSKACSGLQQRHEQPRWER